MMNLIYCSLVRLSGVVLVTSLLLSSKQWAVAADLEYNRDIRPILSDRCFFCHGPDEADRQADLRLDVEDSAKHAVIQTKNPQESAFLKRILSTDPGERMPPVDSGKSLTAKEIATLQTWIEQGAQYAPFWAYVPPVKVPAPHVALRASEGDSSLGEIDRFIQHRLGKEGLKPAPPADPVTLVRRLHFDTIGLPPRPEVVEQFAQNPSEESYGILIDQLLESDHFGERMAIYWLDLVRYADTVGYHGDQDHNISPYRAWVIQALNANMPFDQFTREQLAGDLLPNSTLDQKVATGYNRLLQTSHEGGVQVKEYLSIYAADRVRNLSSVWMGATVGCAQCHSHKYDPYTIKDFYSLAAFFADVDEAQHFKLGNNDLPTRRPPELKVLPPQARERLSQIEQILKQLDKNDSVPLEGDQSRETLQAEQKHLHGLARLSMVTEAIPPREMRVLPRGNWLDDSGPIVEPAVPEFLGRIQHQGVRANRLDLANWLTDAESGVGGLTARVQVNRFWYLLFGTGLSRSLDDFGGQGDPPAHPELLDHLAVEFIESGWNIKQLLKVMLLSQTYRQASLASVELLEQDPHNLLFARQGSYRLPAEVIRDNALAISGLLVNEFGGESSRPYQPAGYYRHLNFPKRDYRPDQDHNQYRRGVYIHWQRQYLHPMLKAFDAPSREECTAQRPRSNTPLAALVLLNDPTFVEAARVFSQNLLHEDCANDRVRMKVAFRYVLSRQPDELEIKVLLGLLQESRNRSRQDQQGAEALLKVGLAEVDDTLDSLELAAWTNVARALFNLNESITRN